MKGYEVTKRGLVIIVVLVIALIVLPVSVISVRALNGSPDDDHPGILTPTPELTPEPILDPSIEPTPEPTPELTPEPTPEPTPELTPEPTPEPVDVPEPGLIDIDVAAGIMSFMFSPELQDSIDTETVSMMRDFLRSPENTGNSRIVARIPNLDEDESVIVVDAIIGAFAQYNVSQNRLSYVIYPAGSGDSVFEISFSFERVTNPK